MGHQKHGKSTQSHDTQSGTWTRVQSFQARGPVAATPCIKELDGERVGSASQTSADTIQAAARGLNGVGDLGPVVGELG